jgi:large subunit ribosomal protein L16
MRSKGFLVNSFLEYGNVGFYSKKSCCLSVGEMNSTIRTLKQLVSKKTSKRSNLFKRIVPTISFTKKPLQTRMGSGKGTHEGFLCFLKEGFIFLEIFTQNMVELRKVYKKIKRKVSFPLGFITK